MEFLSALRIDRYYNGKHIHLPIKRKIDESYLVEIKEYCVYGY